MIPLPTILAGNGSTFFTGCSKTGLPGSSVLGMVLLANVLDATRQSVGVMLPCLIAADVVAVACYRRNTDWKLLLRLLPWTCAGLALGATALQVIQEEEFAPILGSLVLGVLLLELLRNQRNWDRIPHHPLMAALLGIAAGFTTTIGNVAGPLMSLYLLSLGFDKHRFMGSMACFFLIINCLKIPIFVFSDMITPESLLMSLQFIPGILLGAAAGRWIFLRIPQKPFQLAVQILAGAAAVRLLLS